MRLRGRGSRARWAAIAKQARRRARTTLACVKEQVQHYSNVAGRGAKVKLGRSGVVVHSGARDSFGPARGVIWAGADQATALALTRDIRVNDRSLPAGKYSVWVIPRPEAWAVIFSKAADVYHTPYPGEDQDELRLDVRPEQGPHMEVLAFYFPNVEGKDAVLRLHWGTVMVPLSIRVP